jgi:putative flippase GtrA
MNAIVIKVIGQVVVTVLNYVVSKLFVFKEKKIAGELQS